jgi:hypothetical protein
MGTRASDTPHYKAAAAASERAVVICNGLWSGNQTMAQMETHILTPAGDPETDVNHEKRRVSVTYAETMPPRIAVWRNVLGCAQLPSSDRHRCVGILTTRERAS